MKKLALLLFAALFVVACSKSDDEDQSTYTVKYVVASTGDVAVDSIYYLDASGTEVLLKNQNSFSLTFNSVGSYDGKLDVRGTVNNGECDYALTILKDDGIINIDSSGTASTSPIRFHWSGEYSYHRTK